MTDSTGTTAIEGAQDAAATAPAGGAEQEIHGQTAAADSTQAVPAAGGHDRDDSAGDGGGDTGGDGAGDSAWDTGSETAADRADGSADHGSDDAAHDAHDDLVAEGDAAGDYLERLLDILDYDGDIDLDVDGERAVVSIIGDGDIVKLVGDHGQVLDALQELTRLAAGMETGQRSRLMLDIAGYRAKRRAELEELGRETAQRVVASGEPVKLGAMNPFERKVVHDAVATVEGAASSSEGVEPHRRVVVAPSA